MRDQRRRRPFTPPRLVRSPVTLRSDQSLKVITMEKDPTTGPVDAGVDAPVDGEVEVDDDALAAASGGQMDNSTEIVYASTFVPFDSSF
jgi:hypothetical protein